MEELVLEKDAYEIDVNTWKASVPEDELRKLGYVKLADDEQIVQKVELSEEEAKFMKENRHLPFVRQEDRDFARASFRYCESREVGEEVYHKGNRLVQAYFNGYTIKKEKKYYIRLKFNIGPVFLNVNKTTGNWFFETRSETSSYKTQFTQEKIDAMQKDPRAKGLDLNVLKVEVPEDKLED